MTAETIDDSATGGLRDRLGRRCSTCADARQEQGDLEEFLDAALRGGVDIVQLRQKDLEAADELAALEVFAAVAARHDALLAVNDRADVAFAAGADVLHLGQRDLPVRAARAICGPDIVIGRSTHSFSQVNAAIAEAGSTTSASVRAGRRRRSPAGPPQAWTWSRTPRRSGGRSRGSRSAASTSAGWTRYWRPARTGWSWSGRSPRPTTRRRLPSSPDDCGRHPMINNPKAARIVAVVVIAMLVITMAAALFGCSTTESR